MSEALQNAGAAAVTIHGRTMEQRYKRAADWDLVQQAANHLTVPVIGNGDVLTYYEVICRSCLHTVCVSSRLVNVLQQACSPGHSQHRECQSCMCVTTVRLVFGERLIVSQVTREPAVKYNVFEMSQMRSCNHKACLQCADCWHHCGPKRPPSADPLWGLHGPNSRGCACRPPGA